MSQIEKLLESSMKNISNLKISMEKANQEMHKATEVLAWIRLYHPNLLQEALDAYDEEEDLDAKKIEKDVS